MANQIEVYQSNHTAQQVEDAMGAVLSIDENGNWWIGDTDTGVSARGGVEEWELITSVTIEEAVSQWEYNFKDTPMKKIWVYLETPAHTTDTNYTSLCVSTDPGGENYSRNKAPYIYPVPRKSACKQEIYVEMQNRNGEYAMVFHDAIYTNNSSIGMAHGLITMRGNDSYGNPLNGQMTCAKLNTYQIFDAGAKIEMWGVRA